MKKICLLIFMLAIWSSFGQIQTNYTFESFSGYENNIFKLPNQFLSNGTLQGIDRLYTNSFFQDARIKATFDKTVKKQHFILSVNPRVRYYFSESDASYFSMLSRLRYQNVFSKKTKLTIDTNFNYYDREGENLDNNELRTPLGYRDFNISSRLAFRLYPKNRSSLKLVFGNRDYLNFETNDLAYNFYAVHTIVRNTEKIKYGYRTYGIDLSFTNRLYTRTFFNGNPSEKRDWKYLDLKPFYRSQITKKWRIKAAFTWSKRTDSDTGRFTYTEIQPELALRYKTSTFTFQTTASYTNRHYKTLLATNNNGDILGKLNMQYYRLRFNAEKKIKENLFLTGRAYLNNRVSNRTNINTSFFRSYNYYYFGLGIKIIL